MDRIDYRQERLYQMTMMTVSKMYSQHLITKEEFNRLEQQFIKKYQPKISVLISQLS